MYDINIKQQYTVSSCASTAGGDDRFDVDTESGVVRTKGSASFRVGSEYEIGVSAQDGNARTLQKSPTHSLKILVGDRDPQFYESIYRADVPEDAPVNYKWVKYEHVTMSRGRPCDTDIPRNTSFFLQ